MRHLQIFSTLCMLLPALAAAGPWRLRAQVPAGRYPITGALVASALREAGAPVAATQVELPSLLSAATREPQLQITTADLLPDGRLRIRLICEHSGACMPFFATVCFPSSAEGLAALASYRKSLQVQTASVHTAGMGRLRPGQHASMLMEDAHMRITLQVIAIDSGLPGAEVRVSSLDRKQTFRAVVMDADTVRGSLP